MNKAASLTRRATLGSLAASSLLIVAKPAVATSSADSHLLALGRDFDAVAMKLDHAIAAGIDLDDGILKQLNLLDCEIAATQAFTIEGLFVKARAVCWALLGDLDDPGEVTTDRRMALSIVRDLIHLHDPSSERPGALKQLVKDVESAASNLSAERQLNVASQ